jgi:hypothetical protein
MTDPARPASADLPRVRVVGRWALLYAEGADPALDRPAHVRSGSGCVFVETPAGRRLAVVQDDALFVALVDVATRKTTAVPLPTLAGSEGRRLFDAGRGNKKDKLDLEACAVLPFPAGRFDGGGVAPSLGRPGRHQRTAWVAFGSGSHPNRERLAVAHLDRKPPTLELVAAPALYRAMRRHAVLDGAELNIEGVVHRPDDTLLLLQRGNGKRGNGGGQRDAIFEVAWTPLLRHLREGDAMPLVRGAAFSLGTVDGVPLTVTDACALADGSILAVAAAEATENAFDDGGVVGAAIVVLRRDEDGAWQAQRVPLEDVGKPEGIALDPADPTVAWVVNDPDDPDRPSELLALDIGALLAG